MQKEECKLILWVWVGHSQAFTIFWQYLDKLHLKHDYLFISQAVSLWQVFVYFIFGRTKLEQTLMKSVIRELRKNRKIVNMYNLT